jgi:hypothetical protein
MLKKVLIIAVLAVMMFQGAAYAFESDGDIIFKNAMYGAAIGALLGGAFYLADDDDFGNKLGVGIAIGTIGGIVLGVSETRSFVEIEKDKIHVAVPTPIIEKKEEGIQYSAQLFKTRF